MLSKQAQMEEAARLSEKITQSILANLREHVGISKTENDEMKSPVFDQIFDAVVESYRCAAYTVEERDQDKNE